MVNVKVNRSAVGVERYFDRELAVADYLMKEPAYGAGLGAGAWDFVARSGEASLSHCCEIKIPRAASG